MPKRTLTIITYLTGLLTLISCMLSIFNNDIYQDGEWANAQWLGQDMVTVALALPFLLISFLKGIRNGESRWAMVYCGVLLYYAYTYSFFMFAARLTVLYLFHLPIFGLAVIGLVISCIGLFGNDESFTLDRKGLKIAIISYLLVISLMISFLWLNDILSHLLHPDHRSDTPDGEAPLIIYSLDLAIIIPLMICAAFLLYRKTRWGYLLTGLILTKTSTLGFALMAMALSMYAQKLEPDYFLIVLWCIIGILGSALTISYLLSLKSKRQPVNLNVKNLS
jgi:hypothetical protein